MRYILPSKLAVLVLISLFLGCDGTGFKLHPVTGQVSLLSGDTASLAGSLIEVVDSSDSSRRGFSTIDQDGRFAIESLHSGTVKQGLANGTYFARFILNDDDQDARGLTTKPIAERFLSFETSGLSFTVPTTDYLRLLVSKE